MRDTTCFPVIVIERGAPGQTAIRQPRDTDPEVHDFSDREGAGFQARFENRRLSVGVIGDLESYRNDRDPQTLLGLNLAFASMTDFAEDFVVFEGMEMVDFVTTGRVLRVTLAAKGAGFE